MTKLTTSPNLAVSISHKKCLLHHKGKTTLEEKPVVSGVMNTVDRRRVKLPQIELRSFHGNILEWQSFWGSFKAAIHENETLGSIEKFHHLTSLLGGEALLTVEGLQLTGTNYVAALKQLEEQFNIPELIIAAYFK